MVKISILYPNEPDSRFDPPSYLGTHMPMPVELLGAHPGFIKGVYVEYGLSGAIPGTDAAYIAGLIRRKVL